MQRIALLRRTGTIFTRRFGPRLCCASLRAAPRPGNTSRGRRATL